MGPGRLLPTRCHPLGHLPEARNGTATARKPRLQGIRQSWVVLTSNEVQPEPPWTRSRDQIQGQNEVESLVYPYVRGLE